MTEMDDEALSPLESTTSPSSDQDGTEKSPNPTPSETSSDTSPDTEEQPDTPDSVTASVPVTTRQWVLIVTGTMPGRDIDGERERILAVVERDLMALATTDGIHLAGATFRSQPMLVKPSESSGESGATDIALDAPDTEESPTEPDSPSSASPEHSPSDGGSSGSEARPRSRSSKA